MDESNTRRSPQERGEPASPSHLLTTLCDFRTPRPAAHPGLRLVGGYALLEEIGRGGVGVVYKARQLQLGRLVAVKMLRSGCASRDDLLRFRAEAEAVAALAHPGIVQIHEVGEHEGRPYLSLEYVEGGSLDRHLGGKAIAPREAATLVHAIAGAIDFAHRHGVIHRDLKPANILLERGGRGLTPKVTDFGLAKRLDDAGGQTRDGELVGTPAYMSPEQADGRKDIGPAIDVYALGAILYECLTGQPPVTGDSLAEILSKIREQEPIPPHRLGAFVPRDLETICLRCLQKAPDRRYASAAHLADDLTRFLEGRPIAARRVGRVERLAKWARRRPSAAALALVCGLFLLAVLAAGPVHIHALRRRVEEVSREKIEAHEEMRRATLRAECERHLATGRRLLLRGDAPSVQSAGARFGAVHEGITGADALASEDLARLKGEARVLREGASAEGRRLVGADVARSQMRQRAALRDEAFFQLHRDLLGGPDAGHPGASLAAGRAALDVAVDLASLDEADRKAERSTRQEILLLMAEATVRLDGSPGQLHEALALVEEAERAVGPGRAVSMRRARYLELGGDPAGSRRERLRAAAQPSRDAMDSFLVAQEHWLAGDLADALADLDRVLATQPGHFWARLLRAVALQRLGQPADARAELTLCIRAKPDFAWPYLLRATLWLREPDGIARARADLDEASRLRLDRSARFALATQRGTVALSAGDPLGAVRFLQATVLAWPERSDGHANLAQAYWASDQRERAVASLGRAIRLDPLQAGLYRDRSRMHEVQAKFADALRDIDRTLELETGPSERRRHHASDVCGRARILYRLRRHADALPVCLEALLAGPDDADALRLHAEILLELGRPEEALAAFDRYLLKGKPDVEFYRRRAKARAAAKDLVGGVDDFTLALAVRRDAPLLADRGWAYLVANAPLPALRDFDESLRMKPADEARVGRATALVDLGRRGPAQEQIEAVLMDDPTASRTLYLSARVLALLGGATPTRPQRDRTLAVLRRSVLALPPAERAKFWKDQVCNERAFRRLRDLASFDKIRQESVR